jgi:hypothetical protein
VGRAILEIQETLVTLGTLVMTVVEALGGMGSLMGLLIIQAQYQTQLDC